MISLVILIILAWNFYIGYSRGIVLQAYYFIAAIVSLIIASFNYQALAEKITLWVPYSSPTEGMTVSFFTNINIFNLSDVYYAGVAFLGIFVVSYLLFRLLGVLIHFGPVNYFEETKFNVISGILSVLISLIFFSMIFTVLATIPMTIIQETLSSSWLVRFLVNHFPILSTILEKLWVTDILK